MPTNSVVKALKKLLVVLLGCMLSNIVAQFPLLPSLHSVVTTEIISDFKCNY